MYIKALLYAFIFLESNLRCLFTDFTFLALSHLHLAKGKKTNKKLWTRSEEGKLTACAFFDR